VSAVPATARAVIFDCDGVLFDSWHANVAYYNAIRAQLGLPPMDAEWERRAHFLAASSVLEEMFGPDPATLEEALRIARTIDYEPFYELMVPVPGLFDVLASLRPSWRLGMATNRGSTVPGVVRRFGLDAWLDAAVGVLDVARPKPHPDVILECLSRLAVPPAAAVYVGDAESDAAAALAAGVHFIAVGEHIASARIVRDLREVPAVLDGLGLEGRSCS
jgi:HAD superfamily hydrolase (TIGR01509 family)